MTHLSSISTFIGRRLSSLIRWIFKDPPVLSGVGIFNKVYWMHDLTQYVNIVIQCLSSATIS